LRKANWSKRAGCAMRLWQIEPVTKADSAGADVRHCGY
jgi:hypothetical protein